MFTRVEPQDAGPTALGILVPHGARTLVIVRPRSLDFDLLPAYWDGDERHAPAFSGFSREEAAGVARRFISALESAVAAGVNPVQTFGSGANDCLQVWLRTEELVWIVCRRTPGQAYRPMIYASQPDARKAAEQLSCFIWPASDTRQEYYFNTQQFS